MKIDLYAASLLPTIDKDRVIEDCRLILGEIKTATLAVLEDSISVLDKGEIRDPKLKEFIAQIDRQHRYEGAPARAGVFATLHKGFGEIQANLVEVEKLVQATYAEEVAGSGLTYQKANLLQFVELAGFVNRYVRKFLIYAYVVETATYESSSLTLRESLAPAQIEFIEKNLWNFIQAFNVVTVDTAKLKKALGDIPDIQITADNASTLRSTVGEGKIDPLKMGAVPIWVAPIYHVRMLVAEWQANRYKEMKEDIRLLQLRKLYLERAAKGQPDARTEKEISAIESIIGSLAYKTAKMEKAHG